MKHTLERTDLEFTQDQWASSPPQKANNKMSYMGVPPAMNQVNQ